MDNYRNVGLLPMFTHLFFLLNVYSSQLCIFSLYIGVISATNCHVKIYFPTKKATLNHSRLYFNICYTYDALNFVFKTTLCLWVFILLLQAGDIHKNPGPVSTSSTDRYLIKLEVSFVFCPFKRSKCEA